MTLIEFVIKKSSDKIEVTDFSIKDNKYTCTLHYMIILVWIKLMLRNMVCSMEFDVTFTGKL